MKFNQHVFPDIVQERTVSADKNSKLRQRCNDPNSAATPALVCIPDFTGGLCLQKPVNPADVW